MAAPRKDRHADVKSPDDVRRALKALSGAGFEDQVREAGLLVAAAEGHVRKHRARRDEAALALYRAGGVSSAHVYRVIGVSRTYWTRMRAQDRKVRAVARPEVIAAEQAAMTREWNEAATAAREVRDQAATELVRAGLGPVEVAQLAGVTQSRVGQVVGAV